MRSKKNIIFLSENGISSNTISKMSDNQIFILVEKFKRSKKEETKEVATKDQKVVTSFKIPNSDLELGTPIPPELVGKQFKLQKTDQGVNAIEVTEDETINFVEDPDATADGMPTTEGEIKEKFQSKSQQGLFWARCNKCSSKNCKWCKMAKEFSDSTTKKEYKNMPEKKHPKKTIKYKKKETKENFEKFLEEKILEVVDSNIQAKMSKKDLIETIKKKSKSFIIRRPKKVTMFSDEAPMELPIAKMFSMGKK